MLTHHLRLVLLTATVAVAALLAVAGSAVADSVTISALDTNGNPDFVSGVPRTYVVSGQTATPENIYIKYRNPGPTPCGPTADSDSGSWWDGYANGWNGASGWGNDRGFGANGDFRFTDVHSEGLRGTYLFCIWIAGGIGDSVQAVAQTITFRAPSGTISPIVDHPAAQPGQQLTFTISGASEAAESIYAKVRKAGTPCAPSYDADPGDQLVPGTGVNGNFSLTQTFTTTIDPNALGAYVACFWMADGSGSTPAIAGPQPVSFTVAKPVPKVTAVCKAAKKSRSLWTKRVQQTQKQLLHAHRKQTRKMLTRRLKSQRRSLRRATTNVHTLCGT